MAPSLLLLSCNNESESDAITKNLLEKKLVICVKKMPISSSFLWKGTIDKAQEILLLIESVEENFSKIENEVSKLYVSDTFVLLSLPVQQTTQKVTDWMKEELQK